jgi:hypothetical protein
MGELELVVSDAQRTAAVEHLRHAVANQNLGLEEFADAVEAVFAASTAAEVAQVLSRIAPAVRMTALHRRLDEPVVLEVRSGRLVLGSSWQLARETRVVNQSGRVTLDLCAAEFDAEIVNLDLSCQSGSIVVVVPHAVDVQFLEMAGQSGYVVNDLGPAASLPGAPLIRIRARTTSGRIVVRRPEPPKPPRVRRFRLRRNRVDRADVPCV